MSLRVTPATSAANARDRIGTIGTATSATALRAGSNRMPPTPTTRNMFLLRFGAGSRTGWAKGTFSRATPATSAMSAWGRAGSTGTATSAMAPLAGSRRTSQQTPRSRTTSQEINGAVRRTGWALAMSPGATPGGSTTSVRARTSGSTATAISVTVHLVGPRRTRLWPTYRQPHSSRTMFLPHSGAANLVRSLVFLPRK